MSFLTNALFSLSIAIGAVIGIVRYKKVDNTFLPFLLLLWIGLFNEVLSIILIKAKFSNAVNYNIFSLLEAVLILIQFRNWDLFRKKYPLFIFLLIGLALFWFLENFIFYSIRSFNSWFTITHSFIIVIISITMLNKLVFEESGNLLYNSIFLICIAMIIYFSYAALIEIFWVFGLQETIQFRMKIIMILEVINLFTNLIFALAALCIPMKQRYIMLS